MARLSAAVVILLVGAACAPDIQRTTLPSQWQPSPNYSARRPNLVVIHHTGSASVERALATLTDPARGVSAHYVVALDGRILQLVDERMRAWHAGESRWGNETDVNSASIGIELDNDGDEPFPRAQMDALLRLLADVTERHRIPAINVVGHADVAPGRKADPSPWFSWRELAVRGFGLWCDDPSRAPGSVADAGGRAATAAPAGDTLTQTATAAPAADKITPTATAARSPSSPLAADSATSTDVALALRAIGYDTANLHAALRAFRIHYAAVPGVGSDGNAERALLDCLVRRRDDAAADAR